MGDHGDFAECHADNPKCGCVAKVFPDAIGNEAAAYAREIGGTVSLEPVDPDSQFSDMQWEVRFPREEIGNE